MINLIEERDSDNIAHSYQLDYGTAVLWHVVEKLENIVAAKNTYDMYKQLVEFHKECKYKAGTKTAQNIRRQKEKRNKLV